MGSSHVVSELLRMVSTWGELGANGVMVLIIGNKRRQLNGFRLEMLIPNISMQWLSNEGILTLFLE